MHPTESLERETNSNLGSVKLRAMHPSHLTIEKI